MTKQNTVGSRILNAFFLHYLSSSLFASTPPTLFLFTFPFDSPLFFLTHITEAIHGFQFLSSVAYVLKALAPLFSTASHT